VIMGAMAMRGLGAGSTAIGLEKLIKHFQSKVEKRKLIKKFENALLEKLEEKDKEIEAELFRIERREEKIKSLRWLLAGLGAMGIFLASGWATKHLAYFIKEHFLSKEIVEELGKKAEEITKEGKKALKEILQKTPVSKEALGIVKEKAQEIAKEKVATIQKGESVWEAGMKLVKEGKISLKEFNEAWSNPDSTIVLADGREVHISELGLVHEGDQVVFVPGSGGEKAHFEVIDYAKDKFHLGSNYDLASAYLKEGREMPDWLKEWVGLKEVGERKVEKIVEEAVIKKFESENLATQEKIIQSLEKDKKLLEPLAEKNENYKYAYEVVSKHLEAFKNDPIYLENKFIFKGFQEYLKNVIGLDLEEYQAIKDVKLSKFLEEISKFKKGEIDWPDLPHHGVYGRGELKDHLELARIIEKWQPSAQEKELTIDEYLKAKIVQEPEKIKSLAETKVEISPEVSKKIEVEKVSEEVPKEEIAKTSAEEIIEVSGKVSPQEIEEILNKEVYSRLDFKAKRLVRTYAGERVLLYKALQEAQAQGAVEKAEKIQRLLEAKEKAIEKIYGNVFKK